MVATKTSKADKTVNKHIFTWVFAFILGKLGVDRFVRGQVGLGILKLALCTVLPVVFAAAAGMAFVFSSSALGMVGTTLDAADVNALLDANMGSAFCIIISILISCGGNVWAIADWIIAIVKSYSNYSGQKDVTFGADGKYLK